MAIEAVPAAPLLGDMLNQLSARSLTSSAIQSAVAENDGLDAFYTLLKTYMHKGGMALHGNVFNPEDLKKAQKDPEKYKNLQVRVCGWNAYFVNLSKSEQDCFIKQAENNC